MLPKIYRLPSFEIPRVVRYGKRINGDEIRIVYEGSRTEKKHPNARFVFIVSKNVDKRATVRNRMKRLLSESVRHILPRLVKPIDAVLMGSKGLTELREEEVEKRVVAVLMRTGYL